MRYCHVDSIDLAYIVVISLILKRKTVSPFLENVQKQNTLMVTNAPFPFTKSAHTHIRLLVY